MKQKIMKIITVIMLIITLTMVNLIMLCANAITYAVESVNAEKSTSHKNVEFMAYFKDANGNKITEEEAEMNREDLKMYFQIAVKQEGYYNGRIEIKDANFKFKKEKTNEIINEIEENKISLKQINAGETREIEVGIELKKEEEYDIGLIEKESVIGIEGIYRDSTEKDIEIKGERKVKIKIKSPYTSEEQRKISQEVITNKIEKYKGWEKRIIQIKVIGRLEGNLYPVKQTIYELEIPQIDGRELEEIKVHSNEAQATNGREITRGDWEYKKEEGKIIVKIQNEEKENKVSWKKEGEDSFIVTYIYDYKTKKKDDTTQTSDVVDVKNETENVKTRLKSQIELYDVNETKIQTEIENTIGTEERDGIVESRINQSEEKIYKGKLESGIEREITYTNTININLDKIASKIEVTENNQRIKGEKLDLDIDTEYKITVINKEQVSKILGQDGKLKIINAETQEIINTINKDSHANESGEIVVVYPNEVKTIIIQIENADNMGKLEVRSTKMIKTISKNTVNIATEIETKVEGKYTTEHSMESNTQNNIKENVTKIALQESKTEATFEVTKTELSTMTTNKNVEMRVTLKTKQEENELYRNPVIRITLPEKIQKIEVNSINLLYEDELKIKTAVLKGNTIEIQLQGEQTKYKDQAIEGATIIVNANLTTSKKETSSQELIELTYTNQNASRYANEGKQGILQVPVKIIAYTGLVTTNEIKEYGIEQINNEGETTGKLEVAKGAKTINITKQIINNQENKITDIQIIGRYPTKEAVKGINNIDMKVASEIKVTGIAQERQKTYYTENADATNDIEKQENGWKETIEDGAKVKKYLVKINELEKQEEIGLSYNVEIPEKLEYNETAEEGYQVNYEESTTTQSTFNNKNLRLTTGRGPVLETELKAYVGIQEANEVKSGEIIKYVTTVKNTGTEQVSNIRVVGKVPEGTTYITINKVPEQGDVQEKQELITEYPDQKEIGCDISKMEVNETRTIEYFVKVNKDIQNGKQISNTMTTKYLEIEKSSNTVTNTLKQGDVVATLYPKIEYQGFAEGYNYIYLMSVENTSNKDKKDVKVNIKTDKDCLNINKIWYVYKDETIEVANKNEITIKELPSNSKIVLTMYLTLKTVNNEEIRNVGLAGEIISDNETYNSNIIDKPVQNVQIEVTNSSEQDGKYVKADDIIQYNIKVTNNSSEVQRGVNIINDISSYLNIEEITRNGVKLQSNGYMLNTDTGTKLREISINDSIEKGETIEYIVKAKVQRNINNKELINISSKAKVMINGMQIAEAEEVTHIIEIPRNENNKDPDSEGKPGEGDPDNEGKPGEENPGNEGKPGEKDPNEGDNPTRIISGYAWLDQNEDGKRQSSERTISGITVNALNIETNQFVKDADNNELTVSTNSEGFYSMQVPEGKYIIVFSYDISKYILTDYKKEGATDKESSKVINNNIKVEGQDLSVATTEKIELEDSNIANINIGLKEAKIFDLKLDKYISKVTVQNSKGTTTNQYNDATLAKAEIHAKQVNGTSVIVEYKIRVTNVGEVEGYATKIVDYLSSDYKFSSQLNSDWYQSGSYIYNASLSNQKIKPGESKEVTLIVTKTMTENNTGLVNNTAEIAESYNEQGLKDINSTAGNNVKGENDQGSADLILSIKTGEVLTYVALVITSILIIVAAVYLVVRKFVIGRSL